MVVVRLNKEPFKVQFVLDSTFEFRVKIRKRSRQIEGLDCMEPRSRLWSQYIHQYISIWLEWYIYHVISIQAQVYNYCAYMGPCFDLICCWSRVENNFSQFLSFGQFLEWLIQRWSNHFLRVLFLVKYACKPRVKTHRNQFHRFHRHLQGCYYTIQEIVAHRVLHYVLHQRIR